MTLVDTSVWINHWRIPDDQLRHLLRRHHVLMHPFVLGELVAGNLPNRSAALLDLGLLPRATVAQEVEVHYLLENNRLWGLGLGWIDLHLLTAAVVGGDTLLTSDRALGAAATKLGVAYPAN